ncbi:uncharacterized protein LOC134233951 [Saccostrea cucullata]|uniref:uncharacterized protein LOC134233951 n=1 Tax=Saccostrea cuccullata TaxID=36930 RepID=UPI002ED61091
MILSRNLLLAFKCFCLCRVVFVESACQDSHFKWPFLPTTCHLEVLKSNNSIIGPSCPLSFADRYPITNPSNKSVEIKPGFFFDVDVPLITINIDDYGISLYVYPTSDSGTIFDYQSEDETFRMKVWLDGGNLRASRRITRNVFTYLVNEEANPVILNQWQKVGVSVDSSAKSLRTFVADSLEISNDSPNQKSIDGDSDDANRQIVTPGKMRVGASFNESDPRTFTGLVTCLGMVLHKELDCFTDCASTGNWRNTPTFSDADKLHYATFSGVQFDKMPITTPIYQSVTRSLTTCAITCLRDFIYCRSFTFQSQSNTCSLFSAIYTQSFEFTTQAGHIYYKLLS